MPHPPRITKLSPPPDVSHTGHRSRQPGLVHAEEAGTLWVWAWPEILGWREITWLFSPVTGKERWPGDLWGIDEAGELILLETKRFPGRSDPFEDFLEFERRLRAGARPPTVDEIQERWERLLRDERRFLKTNRDALQADSSQRVAGSGVVPYSSKRLLTWRWRGLYLERIAPTVDSPAYERSVESGLKRLRNRAWSLPHYFALFTVLPPKTPSTSPFSAKGKRRYEELRALVSPDHVHVRSIRCSGLEAGARVAVECSCPDSLI